MPSASPVSLLALTNIHAYVPYTRISIHISVKIFLGGVKPEVQIASQGICQGCQLALANKERIETSSICILKLTS